MLLYKCETLYFPNIFGYSLLEFSHSPHLSVIDSILCYVKYSIDVLREVFIGVF